MPVSSSPVTFGRPPLSANVNVCLSGGAPFARATMVSRLATRNDSWPFHSHSLMPPLLMMGSASCLGAARSRASTSRRLDLPDPLGPIRTFSGSSGRSMPRGPKDRSPETFNRWRSMPDPCECELEIGAVVAASIP